MKNNYTFIAITLLLLVFLGFNANVLLRNRAIPKPLAKIVCNTIKTESEAIAVTANYPEVKDFEKRMKEASQPIVLRAERNKNNWNVQVAENQSNHLATFNWYTIDSCGKLKCSFSIYDKTGKYIRGSTEKEYPCK